MKAALQPLPGVTDVKVDGDNKMLICTVSEEFDADKALAVVKEVSAGKFANSTIVTN